MMKGAILAVSMLAAGAGANVRITEYMYTGNGGEFIEITNLGTSAVDLSGWSYDDNSRTPGSVMLSGVLQAGQSLILTEDSEAVFRAAWGLGADVLVIGDVTDNIGRSDEINIYDAAANLVDRLTYGDEDFPGTIRTNRISGNPGNLQALGANDIFSWVLSFVGDDFGSYTSTNGDIGNPGVFIPSPGSALLLGLGGVAIMHRRR
ncbi:MAG: hypothetical protein Kow0022_11930 [Phycisphaerales bacterium]